MDHPALAAALAAARSPDAEAALAAARDASVALPGDPRTLSLLARAHLRLGNLDAARTVIDDALALDPSSIPALIEGAALARTLGDSAAAKAHLGKLVVLAPGHVVFLIDLALTEEQLGNTADALSAWRTASALAPEAPPIDAGLGRCLVAIGSPADAWPHLRRAARAMPDSIDVLRPLLEAALAAERVAEATDLIRAASTRNPASLPLARLHLLALGHSGMPEEELLKWTGRVAERVGGADGRQLLAAEHRRVWDFPAMHRELQAAIALDPDAALARWQRPLLPSHLPFPDQDSENAFLMAFREGLPALEQLAARATGEQAREMLDSTSAFYLHYTGMPLREELSRYGDIVASLAARVAGSLPELQDKPRTGRARVGIISAHLRTHTVMKLFANLIRGLDGSRFEVHLFQPHGAPDDLTESLREKAHSYRCGPGSLGEWAQRIRSSDLDLLVYIDIGMDGFGASLAALRLAPIQAALWGHPVTTGLPTMDLFLSSDAMEPATGEAHYRERLVRLPGLGAAPMPPVAKPVVPADLPPRQPGDVTAFMPQMLQKFDAGFDRVLARIAAASPALRYVFTPYMHRRPARAWLRRLDAAFKATGCELRSHLRYCGWVDQREWLGLVQESDFGLDSFRWSGGNTSLEMFWFDTPIVTLPGDLMRGRHTLAMLQIMELPELIAQDEDDYVHIAVELANSADFRAEMRGRIAERKQRLFDGTAVHAAFADFLVDAAGRARGIPLP